MCHALYILLQYFFRTYDSFIRQETPPTIVKFTSKSIETTSDIKLSKSFVAILTSIENPNQPNPFATYLLKLLQTSPKKYPFQTNDTSAQHFNNAIHPFPPSQVYKVKPRYYSAASSTDRNHNANLPGSSRNVDEEPSPCHLPHICPCFTAKSH